MLFFMRHAPTAWNASASKRNDDEVLRGRYDLPITALGVEEAKRNAGKLARFGIQEVWASPFLRDAQTAEIVAGICGARQIIIPQMAPWDIAGLAKNRLNEVWPEIQQLWKNWSLRPRGGGEAMNEYLERWGAIIDEARTQSRQGKNIVLVNHGTEMRWLPWFLYRQVPPIDKWEFVKPAELIFVE